MTGALSIKIVSSKGFNPYITVEIHGNTESCWKESDLYYAISSKHKGPWQHNGEHLHIFLRPKQESDPMWQDASQGRCKNFN